jgi:urease accessory protein
MAAGGIAAVFRWPLSGTELLIAISVLGLGLAIAFDGRLAWPIPAFATILFGLAHGSAHGVEMPKAADATSYVAGFLVTTAGLHVTGAVGGLLTLERSNGRTWLRLAGVAIGVVGMLLLLCFTDRADAST